jgi:transposase
MDNSDINAIDYQKENLKLRQEVEELKTLVKYYEEQLRLSKHKKYGASSEKTPPDQQQLLLFDEAENEAELRKAEPVLEEITYKRRKKEGKREEDLVDLPVEVVEHSLTEEQKVCPECGGAMHVMGHDSRRELDIIPARVVVKEHRWEVCSCRNCERNGTSVPVVKATVPEPLIKGSLVSPSSAAYIMTQKYVNALPLYRQEQDFLSRDISLSRQTMANWMIRCSQDWLEPVYERMRELLLQESVLHADETQIQVLREPGRASRTESYMWLYRTSGCAQNAIVLYEYQPTRSGSHPRKFLEGYRGYLHTDGYSGYNSLGAQITRVLCFAHARRKFDEALKSLPDEGKETGVARIGLEHFNRLFALEREYEKQALSPYERYKRRLEESKPISDEFFRWAAQTKALPKFAVGKALHYALEHRRYLENVFLDGRLELSNNRAERTIRAFIIGRNNWIFSATQKGARASSVIYSVIQTAKENGLKPFEYLEHLFRTIPNSTHGDLDDLLPWGKHIPDACRMKKEQ